MPGKNNFSEKRFSWYRWSAPVYENAEEVIKAVKDSGVLGKALRNIRIIGDAEPEFRDRNFPPARDNSSVNCFRATQPTIFEFTDGTTMEILPQDGTHIRLGFSTVPHEICEGLNKANPDADFFFNEYLGKLWHGWWLRDIEIQRTTHDICATSTRRIRNCPELIDETRWIICLDNGSYFELTNTGGKPGYFLSFYRNGFKNDAYQSAANLIQKELIKSIGRANLKFEWQSFSGNDTVDIHPEYSDVQPLTDKEELLLRYSNISLGEDNIPPILFELWNKHFSGKDEDDEYFSPWGPNLFTYEEMQSVISDVRKHIKKLCSEDASESKQQMIDCLNQYCDAVEGMMVLHPDAKHICVTGP